MDKPITIVGTEDWTPEEQALLQVVVQAICESMYRSFGESIPELKRPDNIIEASVHLGHMAVIIRYGEWPRGFMSDSFSYGQWCGLAHVMRLDAEELATLIDLLGWIEVRSMVSVKGLVFLMKHGPKNNFKDSWSQMRRAKNLDS